MSTEHDVPKYLIIDNAGAQTPVADRADVEPLMQAIAVASPGEFVALYQHIGSIRVSEVH